MFTTSPIVHSVTVIRIYPLLSATTPTGPSNPTPQMMFWSVLNFLVNIFNTIIVSARNTLTSQKPWNSWKIKPQRMFILKIFKPKSQSLHQSDNGKTLDKAVQTKSRPQIKVWWYFGLIFPGLQASYPNLMPRTKSTDVRLARPCTCASWSRQPIRVTRL
jgi:hypothetical protein